MQKAEIAQLGKPSLIFGFGQEKRFRLVKRHMALKGKKVLDAGCGIGAYSHRFYGEGAEVWGVDVYRKNIREAQNLFEEIRFSVARAEEMPFSNDFFDIVFLHEVLEHVTNDRKAISEALRVLKPGGKIVIFVPNRYFPFETHGIYLGKKYVYKNIPFVNWLPLKIRNIFCPHVRIYTVESLKKLFVNQGVELEIIDFVWPAFDRVGRRWPKLGKVLKKIANSVEKNRFFKKFGISIFLICKKI